jgi:hypothetical protein
MATAIGSLPHSNPEDAVKVVLANIPDAPIWPQLPSTGMNEQMEVQYSENLPDVVIDREKERMYVDTTDETFAGISNFMEKFAMDEVDHFAISPEFSKGIYAMVSALKSLPAKPAFAKVQTTGPISFGLTIVDENKRAIYYNDIYRDAIVKGLTMKCRWQIQRFKSLAQNVICFIDEPILSAFGSSTYVSVQREDVVAILNEVIEAIHAEGAVAGIHCCGNTEWSILVDAGVDIVNFDAFDYGDTVALYPEAIKRHLEAGKYLAWGVIPTNSEKIKSQTVDNLIAKFDEGVDNLAKATGLSRDVIINQAFITPSCGTGSLPVADAELVFKMLGEVSKALQSR